MADGTVRHAWLRALGAQEMPACIELADGRYAHVRTFKHDFFAATGLYAGPSGRVILKMGRVVSLFGLPMRWLGSRLAARECAVYVAAKEVPGVPACRGRYGPTGLVHEFVEGHPLQRHEWVDDAFFGRLEATLQDLHRRGIAYVDLEKRENILVDDQGRPWLIDFQISWRGPTNDGRGAPGWPRLIPAGLAKYVLARLRQADLYHLLKHRRRHRPDTLTRQQWEESYRMSYSIRLHRWFFRPLTLLRRSMLKVLTGRSRSPKQEGPEFAGPPPGGGTDEAQA